jgi:hypothetical protein
MITRCDDTLGGLTEFRTVSWSSTTMNAQVAFPKIFLSHSSSDLTFAEAFVQLLVDTMRVTPQELRCTSVPGFRIPIGTETAHRLRDELSACDIVIGLLTQRSVTSSWVLFELGCRWGHDRLIAPVLAGSLTPREFPGPLQDFTAYRSDNTVDVQNMLIQVSEQAGLPLMAHDDLVRRCDSFASLVATLDFAMRGGSRFDQAILSRMVETVTAFFMNQEPYLRSNPGVVFGFAKGIVTQLIENPERDPFASTKAEIRRHMKEDANWSYANTKNDAIALVQALSISKAHRDWAEAFLEMPLPPIPFDQ